jgi:hypothetical protein
MVYQKTRVFKICISKSEVTNCRLLSTTVRNLSLRVIYCAVWYSFSRSRHCTHCDSERSVSCYNTTFLWMCVPVHLGMRCNPQYCSGHRTRPSPRGRGTLPPWTWSPVSSQTSSSDCTHRTENHGHCPSGCVWKAEQQSGCINVPTPHSKQLCPW